MPPLHIVPLLLLETVGFLWKAESQAASLHAVRAFASVIKSSPPPRNGGARCGALELHYDILVSDVSEVSEYTNKTLKTPRPAQSQASSAPVPRIVLIDSPKSRNLQSLEIIPTPLPLLLCCIERFQQTRPLASSLHRK
jgi:hypothetical protein